MLPRPRPEADVVRDRLRALASGRLTDDDNGPTPTAPARAWVAPQALRPVVIAVLATALAVWIVVRTVSGGGTPSPVTLEPGTPIGSATAGPTAAATSPSPSGVVVVHVLGDVRRPGLVTLPLGSRVADAVDAAGGLRRGGSTGGLNLARTLVDGEQVVVSRDAVAAPVSGSSAGSGGGAAAGPVDLNSADAAALDSLPGVGPVLAERILAWRTEHGRFASVDQLREVAGIGARTFERLAPLVRV